MENEYQFEKDNLLNFVFLQDKMTEQVFLKEMETYNKEDYDFLKSIGIEDNILQEIKNLTLNKGY